MDKFAELLAQAAKILGLQVERLWPRIVWIYWVETLVETLVLIPVILLGIYLSRWLFRQAKKHADDHSDADIPLYVAGGACVAGVLIILLAFFFTFGSTIATLIDPEAAYVRHLTKK